MQTKLSLQGHLLITVKQQYYYYSHYTMPRYITILMYKDSFEIHCQWATPIFSHPSTTTQTEVSSPNCPHSPAHCYMYCQYDSSPFPTLSSSQWPHGWHSRLLPYSSNGNEVWNVNSQKSLPNSQISPSLPLPPPPPHSKHFFTVYQPSWLRASTLVPPCYHCCYTTRMENTSYPTANKPNTLWGPS